MSATARAVLCALACAAAAWIAAAAPPHARADEGDRAEVRAAGVCGRASSARLRLRADDGRIRVDLSVRTPKTGTWRVTILHERRIARRVRVRARAGGGFELRALLPDFVGPDAVRVRAVAPRGESCSAGAVLPGS